jgi:hypothetical protein
MEVCALHDMFKAVVWHHLQGSKVRSVQTSYSCSQPNNLITTSQNKWEPMYARGLVPQALRLQQHQLIHSSLPQSLTYLL